jgi:hypothetical protein
MEETPLGKQENFEQLVRQLEVTNRTLDKLIAVQSDWRLALRMGLISGLGTVLGATVLVSLVVWALQPLKRLEFLKPSLDRIAQQLERNPVGTPRSTTP